MDVGSIWFDFIGGDPIDDATQSDHYLDPHTHTHNRCGATGNIQSFQTFTTTLELPAPGVRHAQLKHARQG